MQDLTPGASLLLWCFSKFEIVMSPSMYRDIKAKGIIYEVDFDVGLDIKEEVVTRSTEMANPEINWPFEQKIDFIRVHGKIASVRLLTSDGKNQLAEFFR